MEKITQRYVNYQPNKNIPFKQSKNGVLNNDKIVSDQTTLTKNHSNHSNSKVKIKLMSPLKGGRNTSPKLKQNNISHQSFPVSSPQQANISKINIELGGQKKPEIILLSKTSRPQTFKQTQTIMNSPRNSNKQSCINQALINSSHYSTPIHRSPSTKIYINNKSFEIDALKSQIVHVTPLNSSLIHNVRFSAPSYVSAKPKLSETSLQTHQKLPTELIIQQVNDIQQLKESYESQMREIKTLQKQIQDNNVQIRELLHSSRASHNVSTSRLLKSQERIELNRINSNEGTEEKFHGESREKTLINQLNVSNKKTYNEIILQRDQVSVQTDNSCLEEDVFVQKPSSTIKFSISKNFQYQIESHDPKEVCKQIQKSREKIQTIQTIQPISEKPNNIDNKQLEQSRVTIQRQSQQLQQEQDTIPVSQQSLKNLSENSLEEGSPYMLNVNLKASRASSKQSSIKYNQSAISLKESLSKIEISNESFKKQSPTPTVLHEEKEQMVTIQRPIASSKAIINLPIADFSKKTVIQKPSEQIPQSKPVVSALKKRINNSIYLS